MADEFDFGKEKKKRAFKKFDREIDNLELENMKTPINLYSKQSPRFKNSHMSSNLEDQANHFHSFWEKRNNRRFHGDSEYRGGFGGKAWRHYESSKEGYRGDTGRPPGAEESSQESSNIITPVILTREKINVPDVKITPTNNSSQPIHTETTKCESVPAPVFTPTLMPTLTKQYQIASKPNVLEAVVVPEQEMSSPLKLLDDSLLLGEDFGPYLLDQNNFLVIAVVGLQGSGKSTIASLLADPLEGHEFAASRSWVFRPESRDEILRGSHSTSGVDTFITKDRIIILDLQPLLSPSVMDYVVTQERKASLDYSSSTENLLEIESLQLLTFAMSVAHVLVVVQDYIFHPNLIRMLHTCQMMKPSQSISHNSASGIRKGRERGSSYDGVEGEAEAQQYFPHLVFVHNRSFPHHFIPKFVEELQLLYQATLGESNLCLESQIGMGSGTFSPPLGQMSMNLNINLFLIPDVSYQDDCSVTLMESIEEMRRQLFSLTRCPLTHLTLTEKSWYQYACRMWENIRKSSLYVEYSRLLP